MPTIASFKRALFNFFRPAFRSVFNCNDRIGVVYLTRLRVGFSHLNEHKFRHNILDTIDPFCACRTGVVESTAHYLLHCPNFANERLLLFSDLKNMSVSVLPFISSTLCEILLYGIPQLSDAENSDIISAVIRYIIASRRFDGSLFSILFSIPLKPVVFLP